MTEANPAIQSNEAGLQFFARGMYEHAEHCFRRAISLIPAGAYAEAHNNLGILLQTTGRSLEAIREYRKSIEISPKFSRPYSNMAALCEGAGRFEDAIKVYHQALRLTPEVGVIWHNMAGSYREMGRFKEAVYSYERLMELDCRNAAAGASYVYTIDMEPSSTPEQRKAAKERWNRTYARVIQKPQIIDRDPDRRLRVGYVSGDFKLHSAAFAFADVLFGHTKDFEVFCYSSTVTEDDATERFARAVDHWYRCVGMSDDQLDALIRRDRIDILVDLSGYTAANRIQMFTRHPAPIQIHAWGYLNCPGIPSIPQTILDPILDVDGTNLHLPCVFHYRPPTSPDVKPMPFIKNRYLTLGYLGRWSKVTPEVAAVWRRILTEVVPNARLMIKDKCFRDERRREETVKFLGIPRERISMTHLTGYYEHLDDHGKIDLALDPWPVNGGVSSLECLWMGVPIVTMTGDRPSARVGTSLMTTLGLKEYTATDADSYVTAVHRALSDLKTLNAIRLGMRERIKSTVIGDAGLYVAHLERLYRGLWHK